LNHKIDGNFITYDVNNNIVQKIDQTKNYC